MKIHVLSKKEELQAERLAGKVLVVLDVLFATSSIVAALAHGAREVIPTLDGPAARAEAAGRLPGTYLLSGELHARTLDGFIQPTPLALAERELSGKSVILSTTNGTVALEQARGAERVYAAALLNGEAMVRHLEGSVHQETVLLVCAGSDDSLSLEDFYGAGYLVSLLARSGGGEHDLSDAALAARMLHDGVEARQCLASGRIGRLMRERGLAAEIDYAAQRSRFDVVPELRGGRLRPA